MKYFRHCNFRFAAMKYSPVFLFLVLLLQSLPSRSQASREAQDLRVMQQLRQEGMERSQVMETAFFLSDVCGPRLSNSSGLEKARKYAQDRLTGWGLSKVHKEPFVFGSGWEVEHSYLALKAPYYAPLIAIPQAWSPGTNGAGSSFAVLVKASAAAELEPYRGRLKGMAVVLPSAGAGASPFTPAATRFTDEELQKFAAYDPAAPLSPDDQKKRAERMALYRSAGDWERQLQAFCLAEGASLLLTCQAGKPGTLRTGEGASFTANGKAAVPCFELSFEDNNRLVRLLEANVPVELEYESRTRFLDSDQTDENLMAEITGTDKKRQSEVVLLGAHLDSWHAATGATDNAAGAAIMMEAMRILKASGVRPRRTIRLALWSAEEQGLLGSAAYVKQHFTGAAAQSRLSCYFNLDNGTGRIRGIYTQGNEAVNSLFAQWLAPFQDLGAQTVSGRKAYGSDHTSFDAAGLPGFQFIQDPIDYLSRTHHTNQDTFDRLLPEDLKQAAVVVAAFAYNAAMLPELLPRKPLPVPALPERH